MTTIVCNRGQLWTSILSHHLLSPHLDFPDFPDCCLNHCRNSKDFPLFRGLRLLGKEAQATPQTKDNQSWQRDKGHPPSEPPKKGRKIGAARKLSKSVENIFDDLWLFLPCAKNVENCWKYYWHLLTFWMRPLSPGPFCGPLTPEQRGGGDQETQDVGNGGLSLGGIAAVT